MLKITKVSDDRIDIDLQNGIDSIEMSTGLDRLLAEAAEISHGKMLYRISNFEMPTLGALMVELGRLPSMFGLLSSFDRCAVLCDTEWLRNVAEFEGAILPGLKIKGFPFDAENEAVKWLNRREGDPLDSVPV